jgi:hypothetical protein
MALKPILDTRVRIPDKLIILVGTREDIIPYPLYGGNESKLTYLQLMRELNIVAEMDESIIR